MKKFKLLLTCEHAVDTIPERYKQDFASYASLLQTHRGIDFGAQSIARHLQQVFHCELFEAQVSRLLIDCNRSFWHSCCFSEVSSQYSETEKQQIIQNYYAPYRQQVIKYIQNQVSQGVKIRHISVHSFTPILDHVKRNADIGLLYDPGRASEKKFAALWKAVLKKQDPVYRVRKNYPYKGNSDGFTSTLRKQFSDSEYLGIEVESNQALVSNPATLSQLQNTLANSLELCLRFEL